jgi:hypothetical protein
MHFQVESIRQQVAIHIVQIVEAVRMVRFGFDVVMIGIEPVRPTRDLPRWDLYIVAIMKPSVAFSAVYPSPPGRGFTLLIWTPGCEGLIDATSKVSRGCESWPSARGKDIGTMAAASTADLRLIM